jgi:hypothetical protein
LTVHDPSKGAAAAAGVPTSHAADTRASIDASIVFIVVAIVMLPHSQSMLECATRRVPSL